MTIYKDYTTEELIKIYQNIEDEAALEEIISRSMGLYRIRAMEWRGLKQFAIDENDLILEAMIKTWEAAKSFDFNKKVKFSTYLGKCVNQCYVRIFAYCARQKRNNGSTRRGGIV